MLRCGSPLRELPVGGIVLQRSPKSHALGLERDAIERAVRQAQSGSLDIRLFQSPDTRKNVRPVARCGGTQQCKLGRSKEAFGDVEPVACAIQRFNIESHLVIEAHCARNETSGVRKTETEARSTQRG